MPSLAEILTESLPQIVERLAGDPGGAAGDSDAATRARLTALAGACARREPDPPLAPATTARELAALRACVYDAIDARTAAVPTAEARALADWFAAATERLHTRDQRRFQLALAHSATVVFEADLDGRMTWIYNSQLERRVGSMIGRRIHELMPPDASAALDELQRQVLAHGTRATLTPRLAVGADTIDMLLTFEALHDAAGEVVGLTGTAVNITELRRTQEQLAQAVAFQEQMIGILGHDLLNPVSAVQAITQLLRDDPTVSSPVGRGLERVSQAARRMAEIIRMVVDFTRTRIHGSLPVARGAMDLGELCRDVVDELIATHPGREIALDARGDLRGAWDHARIAQVVSNLVGNALKHGDRDAPVIVGLDADAAAVTLAVSNRGAGIPADRLVRIFEPFVQGTDAADAHRAGLGLGLYIAKQIVTSHGGTIEAASADGLTTLTVRLARG